MYTATTVMYDDTYIIFMLQKKIMNTILYFYKTY